MRKPVVDYRQFRLSRLREPQFSHLLLLLGWIAYFIAYFLTENLIAPERCHVVHCALDDVIPFCEYFVIPYVLWYVLIVVSLGYFLLYNVEGFRGLQTYINITQLVAMVIYILWPSRQDLRPEQLQRENLCTAVLQLIYAFDTNTGVCPSLHCAYSIGIASAWWKEPSASRGVKLGITLLAVIICVSTAFVKQHSVVDIVAALPVCVLAEALAFRPYRQARRKVTS